MMQVNEAQKRLIEAGYTIDMQSPYKELTILNAKYNEAKSFLVDNGYNGDIIVIGKKKTESEVKK
jgi:hypothetical protein